jgi:hypothetical protein
MRSLFLVALLAAFTAAQTDDQGAIFTYPPQDGLTSNENTLNFTDNLVFTEGESQFIQWYNVTNPNNNQLSLLLWHVDEHQVTFGDQEYVYSAPSRTPFPQPCPF